ncbi:MliC family protein [Microbulbifer litoralis]|uniref:MliC family protein n=1 Tax=Microbulbifer litoralis TaxID=2933965 RepID=UPI002028DD20|nr:MliC family protein [Microbulbifer sp. GX H0434]
MYRAALTGFLCAGLLTACGYKTDGPDIAFETRSYRCENGERLEVKYANPDSGPSMATLSYRGTLVPMHQEPAASGALYVADKGQPGYRWHSKGKSGMLMKQEIGETEEEVLLRDCISGDSGQTRS